VKALDNSKHAIVIVYRGGTEVMGNIDHDLLVLLIDLFELAIEFCCRSVAEVLGNSD